jgi:hypothetical protein
LVAQAQIDQAVSGGEWNDEGGHQRSFHVQVSQISQSVEKPSAHPQKQRQLLTMESRITNCVI